MFKERGKPFVLVFWSRDPDGTQHNQGDSLDALVPGINGPTSLAAIRNADDDLARLRAALQRAGPRRHDRHRRHRRPRLLDDLEGERDQLGGAGRATRTCRRACCRPGFVAIDLAHGARPAAVRSRRRQRAGRRRRRIRSRQRADRRRSEPARRSWSPPTAARTSIYLPDGDKALAGARRRGAARAGLRQRPLRRRRARRRSRARCRSARSRLKGAAVTPHAGDRRSISARFDRLRRAGCAAPSRSPTPRCSRARACTAASAAPTPGTSWPPSGRTSGPASSTRRRRATPTSARPSRTCWG